ncbi:MAG: HpcH/HpaI aldolase/citrate lyase family protein [Dongiaceae bacterium]
MLRPVRPRRSVLYMPGSNLRALEKGKNLPADALILDLEDAVAPGAKRDARQQVCAALKAGGYGQRELIIRVNSLNTPWGYADLVAAGMAGADAILLPKAENAETVRQAETVLMASGAPAELAIWCMMETPRAVLNAEQIASASPRVACLVMGTSDLTKYIHGRHTPLREPMLTSLSLCILAARAFGLAIIDGVHLDLNDDTGFERSCRQGLELGFDGKTLIHPKTIAVANRVFAPQPDEVEWSRRVILAHAEATAEGRGVIVLDGRLIENLHVLEAHRLVSLADAIAGLDAANSPPIAANA